ncbi:MAG: hypothetical protein LBU83_05460 [Bacteroidales bacterium]|jgi:hypothetical protein|nr:hypothetical protein [Bacteroidales bacterium]
MKKQTQNNAHTFESVWAALQETDRILKEEIADRKLIRKEEELIRKEEEQIRKEEEQKRKEEEQIRKEEFAEWERKRKADDAAYENRIKRIDKEMGSWSNNHGSFAEEYFFNSFDYGEQHFFGETFDNIERCLKPLTKKLQDEYDIVLFNCTSVAIIEIKYKAHENDIPTVLKKAETFRILCPDYKDSKIYLGLASMAFYPELEKKCIEHGIAIIKQVGDTVVINDKHLKVF